MRFAADLLWLVFLALVTLTGVALAEAVGIKNEADLLKYIFDPLTALRAVLLLLLYLLWKAWQRSEAQKDELHRLRVKDAEKYAEVIKEQREYHAALREKIFKHEIDSRATMERSVLVIERLEKKLDGS